MPWTETCAMDERMRFIVEYDMGELPMRVLCRQYGISPKTGYKWLHRAEEEGVAEGLKDRSRAPDRHPNQTPAAIAEAIVAVRVAHPTWGPRKVRAVLVREDPSRRWPAASTIGEVLKRAGLVRPRRRRRRTPAYTEPFSSARRPNDVWCADFKGWFRTGDGRRCDPLTVTDAHSRYLLRCEAMAATRFEAVKGVFVERPLDEVIPWLLAHHPNCEFLREYDAYCRRFGVRPPCWQSRPPRWSEWNFIDPRQTLFVVRSALLGQGRAIDASRRESLLRRQAAEEEIRAVLRRRDPDLVSRFDRLLDWAQFWAAVLDDRNRCYVTHISCLELAWQTGIRLQKEGILGAPEGVLLLTSDELRRAAEAGDVRRLQDAYSKRKHWFERNRRLSPPDWLGARPKPDVSSDAADDASSVARLEGARDRTVLRGIGVTPRRPRGQSGAAGLSANRT